MPRRRRSWRSALDAARATWSTSGWWSGRQCRPIRRSRPQRCRPPPPTPTSDPSRRSVTSHIVARLNLTGSPPRNGIWIVQRTRVRPVSSCPRRPGSTPTVQARHRRRRPGRAGGFALHASWKGCVVWGAGIGGVDPRVLESSEALPLHQAAVRPHAVQRHHVLGNGDARLRCASALQGRDARRDADPGLVRDEAVVGINKCSDSWGQLLTLPADGTWQQVVVVFGTSSRRAGARCSPCIPTDVFGIQIEAQGTEIGEPFDFWIDDYGIIQVGAGLVYDSPRPVYDL